MATATMSVLDQVKETIPQNTYPLDEVETQRLMIEIREFQKTLKPIIQETNALKLLAKLTDIYQDSLQPLATTIASNQYSSSIIGKYVNIDAAKKFETALNKFKSAIDDIRNYTDFATDTYNGDPNSVIGICIKPVEISIKEKILPKITTLEYN